MKSPEGAFIIWSLSCVVAAVTSFLFSFTREARALAVLLMFFAFLSITYKSMTHPQPWTNNRIPGLVVWGVLAIVLSVFVFS